MSEAPDQLVLAPCSGRVISLADVPDPVFAGEIVGPGVAIEPAPGRVTVVSPVAGKVLKVHPHAFVVYDGSVGVLVHLGINTVRLEGAGFEVHVAQGSEVAAGDPMITWDPSSISGEELSPVTPVVLMDRPKGSVTSDRVGADVTAGEPLFSR